MRAASESAPFRLIAGLRWLAVLALAGVLGAGCDWLNRPAGDPRREGNFQEGLRAVDEARWQAAKESFHRALEANPENLHAHLALGDLYRARLTNHALALYHYHRYLDLGRVQNNGSFQDQSASDGIRNSEVELARKHAEGLFRDQRQFEIESLRSNVVFLQRELDSTRAMNEHLKRAMDHLTNSLGGSVQERLAFVATNRFVTPPPAPTNPVVGRVTVPPARPVGTQPVNPAGQNPANPAQPQPRTHRVQPGETFSTIARRYNVRLPALQAANPGVDSRRLKQGQTLNIPPR